MKVTHKVIHYNWTEQWPTYLIWGTLQQRMTINIMIWNETLLIDQQILFNSIMDSDTIAHLYSEICSGSDESKLKVNWHTNTRFTES